MPNKSILITGASSGLGLEMAHQFAAKGYDLALCARSIETLEALATELTAAHSVQAKGYALDVCDGDQVRAVLARAAADFGKLDIVVASAGLGDMPRVGSGDLEVIQRLVQANVFGLIATVDVAVGLFREQGFGQVVGLSSVLADRAATPGSAVYSASKAAVTTYMDGVALETYKENIDVTVLAPGYIDTPMNRGTKSRPFVVPVEKGVAILVKKIEARARHAYVPGWPWSIVGPLMRIIPGRFLAG